VSEWEPSPFQWKSAVFFYSISFGQSFTALVLMSSFLHNDVLATMLVGEWRVVVTWIAHIVPCICLVIDFALNSLAINPRLIWLISLPFSCLYLWLTYIGQ